MDRGWRSMTWPDLWRAEGHSCLPEGRHRKRNLVSTEKSRIFLTSQLKRNKKERHAQTHTHSLNLRKGTLNNFKQHFLPGIYFITICCPMLPAKNIANYSGNVSSSIVGHTTPRVRGHWVSRSSSWMSQWKLNTNSRCSNFPRVLAVEVATQTMAGSRWGSDRRGKISGNISQLITGIGEISNTWTIESTAWYMLCHSWR